MSDGEASQYGDGIDRSPEVGLFVDGNWVRNWECARCDGSEYDDDLNVSKYGDETGCFGKFCKDCAEEIGYE